MDKFIGTKYFAGYGFDENSENIYIKWCLQFSFCATASTIVSGSLAERTRLSAYVFFSVLMTGFIYPVIVAWTWGGGWLDQLGFHDFAGSGIVHAVGGVAGFVGAAIVGRRYGKEKENEERRDIKSEQKYGKILKLHDD